jgi:phage tail sheath protein FI
MPATRTYKTPGVYVAELSAFPPSIVGVQTAVPCFVGYTATAEINGKPVLLKPIAIGSLADFEEVFGGAHKAQYTLAEVSEPTGDNYDFRVWDPKVVPAKFKYYRLDGNSSYNLYNSMRLFYANGGGNCYVVSVGDYTKTIASADLVDGLNAAKEQVGPTMLVVPDAVLLPNNGTGNDKQPWESDAFAAVAQNMLEQCAALQDRVAILDVYGTGYLSPPATDGASLDLIMTRFRKDVGEKGLSYGMAYFPFLDTTVVPLTDVNYTSIVNTPAVEGKGPLQDVLSWENQNLYGDPTVEGNTRAKAVQDDIDAISKPDVVDPNDPAAVRKLNDNLTAALPLLVDIQRAVVKYEDVLPPSAAMAGVMTYVDSTRGVWNAPANVTLTSVERPTVPLNADQQGNMNVPVDGKAVDALREFPGRGTVVWGARTLDGNSNDYRYIQVRRTLIYIEQSIKNALNTFVFAANTGQTWTTVVSMVSGFLQGVWSQGGLMGATAAEAFSVECGLGSTMTGKDVLEGYMIVQVTLQMIRPAEFIELTFKQKMEGVS